MFDSFFGAVGFVGGVFGLSVIVREQGWRREAPAKELCSILNQDATDRTKLHLMQQH